MSDKKRPELGRDDKTGGNERKRIDFTGIQREEMGRVWSRREQVCSLAGQHTMELAADGDAGGSWAGAKESCCGELAQKARWKARGYEEIEARE